MRRQERGASSLTESLFPGADDSIAFAPTQASSPRNGRRNGNGIAPPVLQVNRAHFVTVPLGIKGESVTAESDGILHRPERGRGRCPPQSTAAEILINRNIESRLVNLYPAESAAEEGRSKLPAALPVAGNEAVDIRYSSTTDPTAGTASTNPYFDPAFNTNGMTSARFIDSDLTPVGFAWVRISLKTENRAGYLLDTDYGNNSTAVNYGYDNSASTLAPFQFAGPPTGHYGSSAYFVDGDGFGPSRFQARWCVQS